MSGSGLRSIIVTGGARGIGESICRLAASRGMRVGVLDVDVDGARAVASALPDAIALSAAVHDETEVLAAFVEFEHFAGVPDVVVNNAGIVRFGPLATMSVEDWRTTVDVNLTGTFLVARSAAVRMSERGAGSIVNVASINGVAPGPNAGAYGATKAAVILLTQQMAIEFGASGVRVNAVTPGLIDGGMSEPIYADPAVRAIRESRVPVGRLGSCDDVANAVLWLASPEASYVSGHNLVVDGGIVHSVIAGLPRPASIDGGFAASGSNGE